MALTHLSALLFPGYAAGLPSPDDIAASVLESAGYSPAAHSSPVHPNGPRAWRGPSTGEPSWLVSCSFFWVGKLSVVHSNSE